MTEVVRMKLESKINEQALIIEEQATKLRMLEMVLLYMKEGSSYVKEEKCTRCDACICGANRCGKGGSGEAAGSRHPNGLS